MILRPHPLAARRLLLFVSALLATLGAHAVSADELSLVPAAPLAWGALAALTVLAGRRHAESWRRRTAPEILVRLVVLQAVLHCAMTAAPWAFGLGVHHRPALLTPLAMIAHATAALVLTALLAQAERLLCLAQVVARAVRSALAPPPSPARHRAAGHIDAHRVPRNPLQRRVRARGPPATAS